LYLKTLKLVGFKSFADRTRLELEPGVTVVVGPNGSGKSNIVDAISWVMGTQSTRTLRTQKMEDVIFAGTATRPALGRAEVALTFDNTTRALPLDLDEVSITRRLYRDGSSDYQINGMDVRLLDVQELLSDSGVGRHQHVIVGQGQIDKILSAKPEDHRAVIEEAAGVLKHRLRKDRAIRRLDNTDADLHRLNDILGELKRQIRPLRRQARAAERYLIVRDEVKALRLFLGGEDLRSISRRLDVVRAEHAELDRWLAAASSEEQALAESIEPLTAAAGDAGLLLERDTAAAARLETAAERFRRIAQVAHERHRAMSQRIQGAGERRRDMKEEATQIQSELAKSSEEERRARIESERAERELRDLEDEERSLAEQEQMPTEGAVAAVRGDLRSLESAVGRDEREADQIGRRLESLHSQSEAEALETDRLKQDIEAFDIEATSAQKAHDAALSDRRRQQDIWEAAEADLQDARIAVSAAAARVDALESAAAGLADPQARERAAAASQVRGSLATILDIPDTYAAAVDAALGPWSDALAVTDPGGVELVVGDLKTNGLGGVPLVTTRSAIAEVLARPIAESFGLEALVDLLGKKADRNLAKSLLGDVIVAEGWSAGWQVVMQYPRARVVTPEGDLITADGIRVAHPDGATPAVLETARIGLEESETQLARANSRHASARRDFDRTRTIEREALEALELIETNLAGATEAMARLDRTRNAAEHEIDRLEQRRSLLLESSADREARVAELRERLGALEGEEADRQRAWEELARKRAAVAASRDQAREVRQAAAGDLGAIVERRRLLEGRLLSIQGELQDLTDRPGDPHRLEELDLAEEGARRSLAAVRTHIATLRERQHDLRQAAGEAGERLSLARKQLDEVRVSIADRKEQRARLDVESAELAVRLEAVAEALRRDVDATEEQALGAPAPEVEEGVDRRDRLASLEAEMRRMGTINPLAADEYQDLEARRSHLQEQLDDLESSRNELRKVITALDDEIVGMFRSAFDEVAAAYEQHFDVLFPGGRGRLVLTDPDNISTTGVDIEAQPLGKKVGRLTLLSGGERSLAALAFLFAVFKARPSPFYIVDEVEAALDDANLRRFLRLVDEFRRTAQLVVVTHQQQTMEAADILYGVTMEPGGSSKVVAKRMVESAVTLPAS
jgi:chromosome segregation protein